MAWPYSCYKRYNGNMRLTGIQVFVELLARHGVKYLFGNPGTTELPLNDCLSQDKRLQYILGLQEVPVMGMADGYSMASGQIGVVNLHVACGLGNAMGVLYNAYREGTPLLVTAGQQDRRIAFEEPILGGDLVGVAKPWTKWAYEVQHLQDLPQAIQRAVQTALTPPTGPVFLSLPLDLQMEHADWQLLPDIKLPDARIRPPEEALQKAVQTLLHAHNPAILAGSRVRERNACATLVKLAEQLGAPVFSEPSNTHGRLPFPSDHPLYGQGLPMWSPEVCKVLEEFDTLIVVGMDLFRQYMYHEPVSPLPHGIQVIHLDEDAWQLNKNYPLEVGVLGDIGCSMEAITTGLRSQATDSYRQHVVDRTQRHQQTHQRQREQFRQEIAAEKAKALRPLAPLVLMAALAEILPEDVVVVEEAVTTTGMTLERLGALSSKADYFGHRGWALGWGMGCAMGAQLAWPDRPVLAILGDGAAMYGIQGLWSAAKYNLPVVFVVCNNRQYQILKMGSQSLGLPEAVQDRFVGLDLDAPAIDYVGVATALGVEACRLTEPEEIQARIRQGWGSGRPLLIEVPIQKTFGPT